MSKLFEGAQAGDLDYLISNKIHFDEFDSKMGRADDVVTASFKIKQREPAADLVSFMENGYDWVLDADISTGEIDDGEYLVFMEMQRRRDLPKKLMEMLQDLQYLTNIKPNNWKFKWYKQRDYQALDEDSMLENIPMSSKDYKAQVEGFEQIREEVKSILPDIADLKRLSGIK
jgi:hypothetical protein